MEFIDSQRAAGRGIESTCAVLAGQGVRITPRGYRAAKTRPESARAVADRQLGAVLAATVGQPESLYGRRKMTAHLNRVGMPVSTRRVHRLMGLLGLKGCRRGRGIRTTVADRNAARAPDLLDRDFTAPAPNQRWVADFTYVRTWAGFVYVSFVIDCYSRAIVGWHASTSKTTQLVTTSLKMGLWRRDHTRRPVEPGLTFHSDAGSQFTSIRFAETLATEQIAASIGSIGDAYDNALAESTIGLYKNEAIRPDSPFRDGPLKTLEDVEWTTLAWMDWYNNRRLHSRLGNVPPQEHEDSHYASLEPTPNMVPEPV